MDLTGKRSRVLNRTQNKCTTFMSATSKKKTTVLWKHGMKYLKCFKRQTLQEISSTPSNEQGLLRSASVEFILLSKSRDNWAHNVIAVPLSSLLLHAQHSGWLSSFPTLFSECKWRECATVKMLIKDVKKHRRTKSEKCLFPRLSNHSVIIIKPLCLLKLNSFFLLCFLDSLETLARPGFIAGS